MGLRKFILPFVLFLFFAPNFVFARAVTHESAFEGISWSFETTFGFQNLNNMMMSKEGGSSTQSSEALFFYGILYHAYYENLPFLKAQMNLGFDQKTKIHWSENPDFNHDDPLLNEHLRCVEVDVQYQMPVIIGYRGLIFPFVGYTFLNYSSIDSFWESYAFQFHAFTVGGEYSYRITRSFSNNFYFSFAPLMLNNTGTKSYKYFNYGAEFILDYHPLALTFFMAFRDGFDRNSKIFDKKTYIFNNHEIGISFHLNLR